MKLLSLVILLFFAASSSGQEKPLSTDDRGKLIYYEVVELPEVPKDSLAVRTSAFIKNNSTSFKMKSFKMKSAVIDSSVQASGKLIINKTALVLSRPSGEVLYNFYVEIKNGKYRFWLTDFTFIPYQRDRYGNFTASTTVGTPLENKPGKLNAAEWAGYVKATTREVNAIAGRFKNAMMRITIAAPLFKDTPVIPTQKW